jgi:hypothetical protein
MKIFSNRFNMSGKGEGRKKRRKRNVPATGGQTKYNSLDEAAGAVEEVQPSGVLVPSLCTCSWAVWDP